MDQVDSASVHSGNGLLIWFSMIEVHVSRKPSECALASWSSTRREIRAAVPRLYSPLQDVAALSSKQSLLNGLTKAQTMILQEIQRTQQPYWAWSQEAWIDLVCRPSIHPSARLFITANCVSPLRFSPRPLCLL